MKTELAYPVSMIIAMLSLFFLGWQNVQSETLIIIAVGLLVFILSFITLTEDS